MSTERVLVTFFPLRAHVQLHMPQPPHVLRTALRVIRLKRSALCLSTYVPKKKKMSPMRTPAQVAPFHRALVGGRGGQATKSCANSTCRASARYSILPRSAPSPSLALFTVSTRADCYCYCRSNFIIDEAWCPHAGDAPVEYICTRNSSTLNRTMKRFKCH